MTRDTRDTVKEIPATIRCIVCLTMMSSEQARWKVHFRGAEHSVCCPTCVQVFNRSPQQFVNHA